MKTIKLIVLSIMLGLAATNACSAEGGGKEKATFAVGCFDVGASALKGRPGVISVHKGWQGGKEVNRVSFDPKRVSVEKMVAWLKQAGTYIATEPELSPYQVFEKL